MDFVRKFVVFLLVVASAEAADFGDIPANLTMGASQAVRRNAGNSAFEAFIPGAGGGSVTSLTSIAPIVVTPSPITTTGVISETQSSTSTDGWLSSTDWNTFNGKGSGTVTNFSAGDLSPLFVTSEATTTTTPALTFSLSNAAAHGYFGNNTGSSGAPGFHVIDYSELSGTPTPAPTPPSDFGIVAVSGQSNVVADAVSDTLTLAAGTNITLTTNATTDTVTITSTASGGTGTVTDFSAGDLSPLFTTTEATTTTTPALSFVLTSAGANTVFGRAAGTSGAPTYSSSPQFTAIGNLTSNGFVKTSGGVGTLSVDTSTYLTGNQSITLSGDVSGTGSIAITTAIGTNKVTLGMMNTIATDSILGRATASTGNVEVLTALPFAYTGDVTRPVDSNVTTLAAGNAGNLNSGTLLAARMPALTGDVTTTAGTVATTIVNDAVTYAKMQNVTTNNRLLGRATTGAGDTEEITLGTNLSFTGTTLNAAGGGGTPGGSDTQVQFNDVGAFGGDADFIWNKTTNLLTLTGTESATLTDAATNTTTEVLTLGHNSSGTAAASFGTGILFKGESSTTNDTIMGQVSGMWNVATHASRKGVIRFQGSTSSGLSGGGVYIFGNDSLSTNDNTDHGSGVINAQGGFHAANTLSPTSGLFLQSNGTAYTNSSYTFPSTVGTGGQLLRSNGSTGFVNTTAQYPTTAGTSGNVLTSDGTNWTSVAPTTGSGDVVGPSSSIDSEVALFSGTTGKLIKRATGTGLAKLTSGVQTTVTAPSGAVVGDTDTQTLSAKRITDRTDSTTSSATPTINTNNVDFYALTAQTTDITSMTTNLSGSPTEGQTLWIAITGTASRAITWGASFEAGPVALPTTTSGTSRLDVAFIWNSVTGKWRSIGTNSAYTIASTGNVLKGDGAGNAVAVGTATSRKMLVGDGTNFVPSTETWAVPGTTGNVLTSDGTNWLSSAPTGGATAPLDLTISDAGTNSVVDDLFIGHNSSATPVANFGSRMLFRAKDSTTADQAGGKIEMVWTTATHGLNVSNLVFSAVTGGVANYSNPMTLTGGGILNVVTGYKVANAAVSGTILQGNGVDYERSTPTWPTAASTSGKVVKSDGTNLVMSTETYAAPGTKLNSLVSDATNWTAATVPGILVYVKSLTLLTTGTPADIGSITVPAWAATRYRVPGSVATGSLSYILTETQSGTPVAGVCQAQSATGGGGTTMMASTAPSNGAGTLSNWASTAANVAFTTTTITIRQTVNSANAATVSFYIFIQPMP